MLIQDETISNNWGNYITPRYAAASAASSQWYLTTESIGQATSAWVDNTNTSAIIHPIHDNTDYLNLNISPTKCTLCDGPIMTFTTVPVCECCAGKVLTLLKENFGELFKRPAPEIVPNEHFEFE